MTVRLRIQNERDTRMTGSLGEAVVVTERGRPTFHERTATLNNVANKNNRGRRIPAGDMNSGNDRRVPAGDMNSAEYRTSGERYNGR